MLGTLIGIILSGGIVYAATLYKASDVSYQPSDASWEVNNVNEAINSLYNIMNELNTTKTELNNLKSIGDATAEDIVAGKTALVQGNLITGTYSGSLPASISFTATITYGDVVDYAALYNIGYTQMQVTCSGLYTIANYKRDITGTHSVSSSGQFAIKKESSGTITYRVTFTR